MSALAEQTAPPGDAMRTTFLRLRDASTLSPPPTVGQREMWLRGLLDVVLASQDDIAAAIDADFGGRGRTETLIAEVWVVAQALRHTLAHMNSWTRTKRVPMVLPLQPATCEIRYQPKGVVGVIGPWNYPFQLALMPLIPAIAAGNRVLVKPSEMCPRTALVVEQVLRRVFPPDVVDVVHGDASVGAAFAALPFDHLFFTGSTRVGRLVMQAAANNLCPVTLELGGKSPAIVNDGFDVARAARSIVWGKSINAGQTCIAPDYVLIRDDRRQMLADALVHAYGKMLPNLLHNRDYTTVFNERHLARLQSLVSDAEAKGARVVPLSPAGRAVEGRRMAPLALFDVTDDMNVMQEEIFGPLLPFVSVADADAAIRYVNDHPRPLAMYIFDDDKGRTDRILERTTAGGVTVNDTLLHIGNENAPFGGTGPSGLGAYHGERGFQEFSHAKTVVRQPSLNGTFLLQPPYGATVDRILGLLLPKKAK
jgi:coniferyl-aldehyde dehydrogenase